MPDESVTEHTVAILKKGAEFDEKFPLLVGPGADQCAREHVYDFVAKSEDHVRGLIKAAVIDGLGEPHSVSASVRWFDQLHAMRSGVQVDKLDNGDIRHCWDLPGVSHDERFFLERVVWEHWYSAHPGRSLSLTPVMFHLVDRGGLISNDPNLMLEEERLEKFGFTHWYVAEAMDYLNEEMRERKPSDVWIEALNDADKAAICAVAAGREENEVERIHREAIDSLLNPERMRAFHESFDGLAEALLRENLLNIPSFFLENKKFMQLFDEGVLEQMLARYLVVTWLYEHRVVGKSYMDDVERSQNFYYVYLPYLPRVASVLAGTAFALHASRFPLNENFLGAVTNASSLWAQFPVRAMGRRRAMVEANKSARAAIMSRNLSHNIGSHALANPTLYDHVGLRSRRLSADPPIEGLADKDVVDAKGRLSTFHHYLQARLDFIARAMHEHTERTEPMFLVKDVLGGLFRQTVLLDTMLRDLGFPSKEAKRHIRFAVQIEDQAPTVYTQGSDGVYDSQGLCSPDRLVGMAGGSTACQAIYSFVENVMRNAAKYGARSQQIDQDLEISIRLRKPRTCEVRAESRGQFWVLEISEGLTDPHAQVPKNRLGKNTPQVVEVVDLVRCHLNQEAIDMKTGEARNEGLGIQDMKFSASFLANGQEFISDRETWGADCRRSCEYCRSLPIEGGDEPAMRPLRAFARGDGDPARLVYQLLLPRANLLCVLDLDDAKGSRPDDSVEYVDSVGGLAGVSQEDGEEPGDASSAAFAMILDSSRMGEAEVDEAVLQIARHDDALPFRLMIVCESAERQALWRESIRSQSHLHTRRLRIVNDPDLRESLHDRRPESFQGAAGWHGTILRIFHVWTFLRDAVQVGEGWKNRLPEGGRWRVGIGFQREKGSVLGAWKAPLNGFGEPYLVYDTDTRTHQETRIDVAIIEKPKGGDPSEPLLSNGMRYDRAAIQELKGVAADFASIEEEEGKQGAYIFFDNHGECFQGSDSGAAAFYQEFSGGSELTLFQALENPPGEAFAFGWYIYSIVDSALTRVAILDERVFDAAVNPPPFERAGILPLGFVEIAGERHWLKIVSGKRLGLRLEADSPFVNRSRGTGMQTRERYDRAGPADRYRACVDVLIVHEGVLDLLGQSWAEDSYTALRSIAPRVIRTSGRGAQARNLKGKNLPFIEFSELSETVYRSRNKLSLGRAVASVSGRGVKEAP